MLTALAFALFAVVAVLAASGLLRRPATDPQVAGNAPSTLEWAPLGVRILSSLAAVALVVAALFFFRAIGGAAIYGLLGGLLLAGLSELPVVRRYPVTANAMAGAGIGVVFASLYAMLYSTASRLPFAAAAIALIAVMAGTVWLSLRRDSLLVPLLGLTGAFAAPALPGFGEDGLPLFFYLLVLNAGAAWLAIKKGWAVLTAIAVPVTVLYEWAWVLQHLTWSRLPLTAAMFALLAIAGASPLWVEPPREHAAAFRRAAAAAALLPLLFAFYMAVVPNYAARYNVLFAFLLVIAAGLAAVVWRGAPRALHVAGGVATLLAFFLWFARWLQLSEVHQAWPVQRMPGLVPWMALWAAAFVLLYLFSLPVFAALLFFAFLGLAIRQPQDSMILMAALLVLLAVVVWALRRSRPVPAAIAAAFASLALMALHPLPLLWPLFPAHALQVSPGWWLLLPAHALVFAALFAVAWSSGRHVLTVLAVPFYAAMAATIVAPDMGPVAQLLTAVVPYALFIAYALLLGPRAGESAAPYVAAALASLVLLLSAWAALDHTPLQPYTGVVPLLEAVVPGFVLWRTFRFEPREPRFTLLVSTTLAFFSAAIPMLLPPLWTVVLWAIEVAALMFLFTRLPHPALAIWAVGLASVVFLRLAFEADLDRSRTLFIVCGLAMFAAARFSPPMLRLAFSLFGLTELLFRINIEVGNYYQSTGGAMNLQLVSERQDATYTIVWAVVATSLLAIGVFFRWRGARAGALGLLILTIFKCLGHDVRSLHDDYRVASLLTVGLTLVVAGALLQTFGTVSEKGTSARTW